MATVVNLNNNPLTSSDLEHILGCFMKVYDMQADSKQRDKLKTTGLRQLERKSTYNFSYTSRNEHKTATIEFQEFSGQLRIQAYLTPEELNTIPQKKSFEKGVMEYFGRRNSSIQP